jgi:hypothetical protein
MMHDLVDNVYYLLDVTVNVIAAVIDIETDWILH